MSPTASSLAAALRDLTAAYHQGGATGEAAYERAMQALATYNEEFPALTPLWRRLSALHALPDLPMGCQFAVLFRAIAALLHPNWDAAEVSAWLILEARRAEANE